IAYLVWCQLNGTSAFLHQSGLVDALLLASGVVTSIPLVLFAFGARQVPYSTIGVIQFIGPSLQMVCGLVVFKESLEAGRATGFVLIWIGLLIYVANAVIGRRQQLRARSFRASSEAGPMIGSMANTLSRNLL